MAFQVQNPAAAKAALLAAAKAKAATPNPAAIQRYIPAGECKDRIRIVFDDSGSMYSQVKHAKDGVVEFLRNCIPNQTSVAIHFLKTESKLEELNSNLIEIASKLQDQPLSMGGTPLFEAMMKALSAAPFSTRLVVFTDGQPTDSLVPYDSERSKERHEWYDSADVVITKAKEHSNPIDTVFFGESQYNEQEIKLLKYLSDSTGGFFLHFDPKKPNIWKSLKYLAPVNRLMLASESFRAEVENGTHS